MHIVPFYCYSYYWFCERTGNAGDWIWFLQKYYIRSSLVEVKGKPYIHTFICTYKVYWQEVLSIYYKDTSKCCNIQMLCLFIL